MPFDPYRFLELAHSLSQQDDSEAALRTAVGRAYYAVFLAARDRLGVTGRRNLHGRVIGEFRRHDRSAGDQLDKLEELRVVADYYTEIADPLFSNWQTNWSKALRFANFIMERLP